MGPPIHMAPTPQELNALIKKAKEKIKRNAAKGVEIAGSEFDPTNIGKNLTARQRQTAANKLNKFLSRKTQFVPDARHRPIPIKEWRAYKKVEAKTNEFRDAEYAKMKGIKGPGGHMTLGDMVAVSTPSNPHLMNATNTHNPAHRFNRKSTNIASRKALKKMIDDVAWKGTADYEKAMVESSRSTIEKMLTQIGDNKTLSRVQKLSDKQINVLWNYGRYFSNELTVKYQIYQSFYHEGEPDANAPRWAIDEIADVPNARMEKYLSWVEKEIK